MNSRNYENDEIDLKDYFDVIVRRKKVIIYIFIICVFTSALISFLIPKVYQADAAILITPSRIHTTLSPSEISLNVEPSSAKGEYLSSRQPTISLPTHKLLLTSNIVLGRVLNNFSVSRKSKEEPTISSLMRKLKTTEIEETGIIQLEVQDNDPNAAKDIANIWAEEYIKYNQEIIIGEVTGTGEFINKQFELAKENLSQSEKKINEFKDKFKLDLMKAELDIKKGKLNSYKRELEGLEIDIKMKDSSLKELNKEIIKQEKFIIVSKAITDDALWQKVEENDRLDEFKNKKLSSEVINPIYQTLEERIVDTEIELNTLKSKFEYLTKSIAVTAKEIDELEKAIHQKQFELTELIRQTAIYKTTYDNLSSKIEEARIIKAAQLGEVKLVSPAIEPAHPVKPKRIRIVATAGIISLFMGVFIAFWLEFWEKGTAKDTK